MFFIIIFFFFALYLLNFLIREWINHTCILTSMKFLVYKMSLTTRSGQLISTLREKLGSCHEMQKCLFFLVLEPFFWKFSSLRLWKLISPSVYSIKSIFCGSTYVLDSWFWWCSFPVSKRCHNNWKCDIFEFP